MGAAGSPPKIIVVGNEKGGSGKTTVAMHVAIGLLRLGFSVGTVDIDTHQRSLTRYLDNRRMWCEDHDRSLPAPRHCLIGASELDSVSAVQTEERLSLTKAIEGMGDCAFLVLDCPGGDGQLSRFAHSLADTLITPLNDSFVDLDLLLQFRPGCFQVLDLGDYFQMLWHIRHQRRQSRQPAFDWVVVRNRLSSLVDQNKRNMVFVLEKVAPIMTFRLADGLGERIIFRQLFQQGLTVLDIDEPEVDIFHTNSHAAARGELRTLFQTLGLPDFGFANWQW